MLETMYSGDMYIYSCDVRNTKQAEPPKVVEAPKPPETPKEEPKTEEETPKPDQGGANASRG